MQCGLNCIFILLDPNPVPAVRFVVLNDQEITRLRYITSQPAAR